MSKSKVNVKNQYVIKKVQKVMRFKDNNFEPATYEIFKVSGPNGIKKYFVSRKDAKAFVDKYTDTKMSVEVIHNIMREIRMK
jgi:hypothetical protein